MRKFNAFTLAEVLITLGIIGVVAAMTMPTLINQTNGAQYKAAYKKALSAISQGVTLNVALDDISFADKNPNDFLPKRMNVVKTVTGSAHAITEGGSAITQKDTNTVLYFNDSSMFSFTNETSCTTGGKKCTGFIDVNGEKGPNKVVSCTTTGTDADKKCSDGTLTVTDVYPVYYFDQTILPNSTAAREVLYAK